MVDVPDHAWGSRWATGDLPADEQVEQLSVLVTAVVKLFEDELGPFVDEGHTPEIVLIARFPHKGKLVCVGVMMPDDTERGIEVMEDILGALRQQQSEAGL